MADPTPQRALWTVPQYVRLAKSAQLAEREQLVNAPVLLVTPSERAPDWDDAVHTTVGVSLAATAPQIAQDSRLVVPLMPGALNATPDRLTLGRSSVCDVVLPFSDVSKVHAYLHRLQGDGCEIEDAGSTNGTVVQGRALPAGARVRLKDGFKLAFGGLVAEFRSAPSFHKEFLSDAQAG